MDPKDIVEQLRIRIHNEKVHFGGYIPERNAIAWLAYISALAEWGVISISMHDELRRLLPEVNDDPSVAIALGREEPDAPGD